MDKDRVEGAAKRIRGALKQGVGRALGDQKLQTDGTADKIEGTLQNAVGGVKDALRGNRDDPGRRS